MLRAMCWAATKWAPELGSPSPALRPLSPPMLSRAVGHSAHIYGVLTACQAQLQIFPDKESLKSSSVGGGR